MDDKVDEYKIAVASSDGIVVNQHFGRADTFYIYTVKDNKTKKTVEVRKVQPICQSGTHSDEQLFQNISRLQDCRYIIVSRIGVHAAAQTDKLKITPMELPGMIGESVKKVIDYEQIQNLLERNLK